MFIGFGESADLVSATGALLTGLSAIMTAIISVRRANKRARSECDDRIQELGKAFHEGMRLADERGLSEEERWSHMQ